MREPFPVNSNQSPYRSENQVGKVYRPINLNLYLMFIANFQGDKYQEGMTFISSTIDFFQRNPAFYRSKNKSMPLGIDKLLLEIDLFSLGSYIARDDVTNMRSVSSGLVQLYLLSGLLRSFVVIL